MFYYLSCCSPSTGLIIISSSSMGWSWTVSELYFQLRPHFCIGHLRAILLPPPICWLTSDFIQFSSSSSSSLRFPLIAMMGISLFGISDFGLFLVGGLNGPQGAAVELWLLSMYIIIGLGGSTTSYNHNLINCLDWYLSADPVSYLQFCHKRTGPWQPEAFHKTFLRNMKSIEEDSFPCRIATNKIDSPERREFPVVNSTQLCQFLRFSGNLGQ